MAYVFYSNSFQFYFGFHQQIPLHFVTLDGGNIVSVDKRHIGSVVFICLGSQVTPKQSLSRPISNTPKYLISYYCVAVENLK